MNKILQTIGVIALVVFGSLFTQSCEKIKDLVAFDVEQDMPAQNFQIDSTLLSKGENVLLFSNSLDVDLVSIFEEHDISNAKISNGSFKTITIEVDKDKSSKTLGFLSSVSFKLGFDENAENSVLIASKDGILNTDTKITFEILEKDIFQYIENEKFYFYVYGVQESAVPSDDLDVIVNSVITFTVNPLK